MAIPNLAPGYLETVRNIRAQSEENEKNRDLQRDLEAKRLLAQSVMGIVSPLVQEGARTAGDYAKYKWTEDERNRKFAEQQAAHGSLPETKVYDIDALKQLQQMEKARTDAIVRPAPVQPQPPEQNERPSVAPGYDFQEVIRSQARSAAPGSGPTPLATYIRRDAESADASQPGRSGDNPLTKIDAARNPRTLAEGLSRAPEAWYQKQGIETPTQAKEVQPVEGMMTALGRFNERSKAAQLGNIAKKQAETDNIGFRQVLDSNKEVMDSVQETAEFLSRDDIGQVWGSGMPKRLLVPGNYKVWVSGKSLRGSPLYDKYVNGIDRKYIEMGGNAPVQIDASEDLANWLVGLKDEANAARIRSAPRVYVHNDQRPLPTVIDVPTYRIKVGKTVINATSGRPEGIREEVVEVTPAMHQEMLNRLDPKSPEYAEGKRILDAMTNPSLTPGDRQRAVNQLIGSDVKSHLWAKRNTQELVNATPGVQDSPSDKRARETAAAELQKRKEADAAARTAAELNARALAPLERNLQSATRLQTLEEIRLSLRGRRGFEYDENNPNDSEEAAKTRRDNAAQDIYDAKLNRAKDDVLAILRRAKNSVDEKSYRALRQEYLKKVHLQDNEETLPTGNRPPSNPVIDMDDESQADPRSVIMREFAAINAQDLPATKKRRIFNARMKTLGINPTDYASVV